MYKRILAWVLLLLTVFAFSPNFSNARWYDPETGQYISPDPVFDFPENSGSQYGYAGQDPVNNIDPTGKEFDLNSKLVVASVSLQIAAMRLAPYAPTVGDILLGFVVDDPTISFAPLGSTVNMTKRAVIETVMHKNIISRGYECVAMQFRSNGPGIDALYLKNGTSVLDDAKNLFRVEYKVTGSGKTAQEMLGSTSYGVQTSRQWDEVGYERLMQAPECLRNMTWDDAISLPNPPNWTSLSDEELKFARKHADDVQKRLVGATVIDDATDRNGPMIVQIKEFSQEYIGDIGDAPKASFLQETHLEVIPVE